MHDIFDFPNLNAKEVEELATQVSHYLVMFKERLEFVLTSISKENLSRELLDELNSLGANLKKSEEERADQIAQVSNKTISVSDVLNSASYKASLQGIRDDIPKKYLVSAEQVTSSNEDGGINVYGFTDETGEQTLFEVKNGKTPTIEVTVNYETGNLEYTVKETEHESD